MFNGVSLICINQIPLARDSRSNFYARVISNRCVLTAVATPSLGPSSSPLLRIRRVSPRTDDPSAFPSVRDVLRSVSRHGRPFTVLRILDPRRTFRRVVVVVAAGWEISIRRGADSWVPGRGSRDPRRLESCLPSGGRAYCEVEGRTTKRKRRKGEERPSEGHASAHSLVRSQTEP